MLTFTPRAKEKVLSYIERSGGELTALRIRSRGVTPLASSFDLTLVGVEDRGDRDVEFDAGDFRVLMDEDSAPSLQGATVDFVERPDESGFRVEVERVEPTPAASDSGSGPTADSPLADRVRDVLDNQINPAVAGHGGVITLVDVKDTELFITMGGGCQGCALSRMTLRQGVERMIRQAVPEVTVIHDVTDHDEGENPYY